MRKSVAMFLDSDNDEENESMPENSAGNDSRGDTKMKTVA
jgi:hypothetical protein